MNPYDVMSVALLVQRMRDNARCWHDADEQERNRLEKENQDIARRLLNAYNVPVNYNRDDGTWRVGNLDGPKLFDLY